MLEKFFKYLGEICITLDTIVVLDSRYKMKIIEFYFEIIYGEQVTIHLKRISDACVSLLEECRTRNKTQEELDSETNFLYSPSLSSQEDIHDGMTCFDAFVRGQIGNFKLN